MEYFTVKQIAEKRGVSERAVYKQLKTHESKLKGHTREENGKRWYDEEVIRILDEAAAKSPAVYVENAEKAEVEELRKKVAELQAELDADRKSMRGVQDTIAELMKQNMENARLAADSKLYIEQKERLQEQIDEKDGLLQEKDELLLEKDRRFQKREMELNAEIERLKAETNRKKKGFWSIFSKDDDKIIEAKDTIKRDPDDEYWYRRYRRDDPELLWMDEKDRSFYADNTRFTLKHNPYYREKICKKYNITEKELDARLFEL